MIATAAKIHVFEAAGLGVAPFRFVGEAAFTKTSEISNIEAVNRSNGEASSVLRRFKVDGGICNFCGRGILVNMVIQDSRGECFVVGCECVNKAGDKNMVEAVKLAERARRKKIATDKKLEAARNARANAGHNAAASEWVSAILETVPGGFAYDMARKLRGGARLASLSPRQGEVIRDMLANAGAENIEARWAETVGVQK